MVWKTLPKVQKFTETWLDTTCLWNDPWLFLCWMIGPQWNRTPWWGIVKPGNPGTNGRVHSHMCYLEMGAVNHCGGDLQFFCDSSPLWTKSSVPPCILYQDLLSNHKLTSPGITISLLRSYLRNAVQHSSILPTWAVPQHLIK